MLKKMYKILLLSMIFSIIPNFHSVKKTNITNNKIPTKKKIRIQKKKGKNNNNKTIELDNSKIGYTIKAKNNYTIEIENNCTTENYENNKEKYPDLENYKGPPEYYDGFNPFI